MVLGDGMNQDKFLTFRKEYPVFYFRNYQVINCDKYYLLEYFFEIPHLSEFHPTIKIYKEEIVNNDAHYLSYMAYQIGLVELVSYWKCTCSPNIVIEAGDLTDEQIEWFSKLYYWGQGEFRYVNGIEVSMEDWVHITCTGKTVIPSISYEGLGNLIAVGGGKDSAVSLEILRGENNLCFMINPKEPGTSCMKEAGYLTYLKVERIIDPELLRLNKEGFLNGHTPFSALVAFVSYLCAYLSNRKYIVLSNEGSANESTVLGTNINHQYSKTYEFEDDFNRYAKTYLRLDIHYFSMLRCLNELQIAMLFSHYSKYHTVFKSCNVGSKNIPWTWCCDCPKCLFVYIILSPFLTKQERMNIFGEDLYNKPELLNTFLELLGYAKTKPFECVGTLKEVRFAVSKVAEKGEAGYLLDYYRTHYPLSFEPNYLKEFNQEHHIPSSFLAKVKEELKKYDF